MRHQVHWALGTSSSGGTVDHLNLELRSEVSGCYSTPTYAFMARTVTTLPLLYCPNQECLQLKRLFLPSPQLQTINQYIHIMSVFSLQTLIRLKISSVISRWEPLPTAGRRLVTVSSSSVKIYNVQFSHPSYSFYTK